MWPVQVHCVRVSTSLPHVGTSSSCETSRSWALWATPLPTRERAALDSLPEQTTCWYRHCRAVFGQLPPSTPLRPELQRSVGTAVASWPRSWRQQISPRRSARRRCDVLLCLFCGCEAVRRTRVPSLRVRPGLFVGVGFLSTRRWTATFIKNSQPSNFFQVRRLSWFFILCAW